MDQQNHQNDADYLLANLWESPRRLFQMAADLDAGMFPEGDAGNLYSTMIEVSRDPDTPYTISSIEQAAKGLVSGDYISRLQYRTRQDDERTVAGYIERIRKAGERRQVIKALRYGIIQLEDEATDHETVAGDVIRKMAETKDGNSGMKHVSHYLDEVGKKIGDWEKGIIEGLSTGFEGLDRILRLMESQLTIVSARPGQGKTALAMQIAENVAKYLQRSGDNGNVGVFSAEMSGTDLAVRMACGYAGLNGDLMQRGKGTAQEYAHLRKTMKDLYSLPLHIDENSSPTTDQMYFELMSMQYKSPCRMMIFDFVELGGDKVTQSEELRISMIARQLKAIAKKLKIPVIAISQVNRQCENRMNKMPQLADLRSSGMLEQVGDNVLFIMRPEYYISRGIPIDLDKEIDAKGIALIQCAKRKNGPIGLQRLAFVEHLAKFSDLEIKRTELDFEPSRNGRKVAA